MSIYTENQNNWNFNEKIIGNFWNRARNIFIEKAIQEIPGIKKSRILDIGCGVGVVVKNLINHGYDCWGCEPSKLNYSLINNKFFNCEIEKIGFDFKQSVEVVILADVIEHIAEDVQFIKSIISELPNLKFMLITVPAHNLLWHENDELAGHQRRYSKKSLLDIINKSSSEKIKLQTISIKNIFFTLSLLIIIAKFIKWIGLFKTKSNINKDSNLDNLLFKLSLIDYRLQIPFGTSLISLIEIKKN